MDRPAPRAALEPGGPGFCHWTPDPAAVAEMASAEAELRAALAGLLARRGGEVDEGPTGCDDATLADRLGDPGAWSDAAVRPEVGDGVVLLNGDRLDGDPDGPTLRGLRDRVDRAVGEELARSGHRPPGTAWRLSGHLWYRPGGAVGWHTNQRVPGWRAYLTWVPEPGRSFFRYREPGGRVVTSTDQGLDLRLFHVAEDEPFWHCVGSEVDRHSLGYRLVEAG